MTVPTITPEPSVSSPPTTPPASPTQNLVANYGSSDKLGGLSGVTQMLQAQQMALQPQLASDVQSGNYTGAFKLATDNMSLLPSLMGPNSNSTLPTETLGATKTGYGAPVVNFAQGPNTGLSTMQKTWTPQQTQSYYDAFKGALPTIEQNMPADVAAAFDPNPDARSPLANIPMATYKSASSLPSQAPMLGGTPDVGKAFQNLISVPQQSQTDEMLIKMAIGAMVSAALGPELLGAFSETVPGTAGAEAAAATEGAISLPTFAVPSFTAAPGFLATAGANAITGGLSAGMMGQNVLKGALMGGVSGGLNYGINATGIPSDISEALNGGKLGNAIGNAAGNSLKGGAMNAIFGGNVGQGMLRGAGNSLANSAGKEASGYVSDAFGGGQYANAAGNIVGSGVRGGLAGALSRQGFGSGLVSGLESGAANAAGNIVSHDVGGGFNGTVLGGTVAGGLRSLFQNAPLGQGMALGAAGGGINYGLQQMRSNIQPNSLGLQGYGPQGTYNFFRG
jgi:hypothetical protein